jgi:uncharacterized protein YgiB involved in biofilm formation
MSYHSKMSSYPTLTLGTLALAAALTSGCGPTAEVNAFKDIDDCVRTGLSSQTCTSAFQQAKAQEKTFAPRYHRQSDCEEDYGKGKCNGERDDPAAQTTPRGGGTTVVTTPHSYYYPQSNGFTYTPQDKANISPAARAQPIFKHESGATHFGNGNAVTYGAQRMSVNGVEVGSRAVYASGQSVAKGTVSSMPHFSSGISSSSARGFGSTAHAGGFSSGG